MDQTKNEISETKSVKEISATGKSNLASKSCRHTSTNTHIHTQNICVILIQPSRNDEIKTRLSNEKWSLESFDEKLLLS